VPLSDHEQKLLDEIEQALYAEDPKFAAAVRSARTRSRTRRSVVLGVLGVITGLALVLVGLFTTVIVLSVIGFVLLVGACAFIALTLRTRVRGTPPPSSGSAGARVPRQSGLRSRMEDRLRRRFDEN
jgi:hypothetical protein